MAAVCPKCSIQMRPVDRKNIDLDLCTRCGGLWFDTGELESLMTRAGLKKVYLPIREDRSLTFYKCPRCAPMNMYHSTCGSIELEFCENCRGIFLDDGEIKQLHAYLCKFKPRKPAGKVPDDAPDEPVHVKQRGRFSDMLEDIFDSFVELWSSFSDDYDNYGSND